ncbi:MAG: hypothetical protein GY899_00970 [Verrucomicrobiaceae bacterium]|nr:hypothetical protein [Verrucomicrobiaceae bacterium]
MIRFSRMLIAIDKSYELKKPYLEDAAEVVFVVEDSPERIVLQHVLWVESYDRVVKHWKQEWKYEDRVIHEFAGNLSWRRRNLSKEEAQGTWSQKVSQVDDSPRYESYGKWIHSGGLSSWQGNQTRRPLPRREYTKRKDYDIFMAVNRHTLTPSGWVHEQDNIKQISSSGKVLCREVGLNQYYKTVEVDFSEVKKYWASHLDYWSRVSAMWEKELEGADQLSLHESHDGKPLYRHLFEIIRHSGKATEHAAKAAEVIGKFVIAKE